MAYLFALVDTGLFQEIRLSFLPVGHTHTDIDQMFSRFSKRLEEHDALTRRHLLEQCKAAFSDIGKNTSDIIGLNYMKLKIWLKNRHCRHNPVHHHL